MSATATGAPGRKQKTNRPAGAKPASSRTSPMVLASAAAALNDGSGCSFVDLGDSARLAVMLTPRPSGSVAEQADRVLAVLGTALARQSVPMEATLVTVFLADQSHREQFVSLLEARFGERMPVVNFVPQRPCNGAALALEVWGLGGRDVKVERYGPNTLAASYDSVRWVYVGGIEPPGTLTGVHAQTLAALEKMRAGLTRAGASFEQVVRTWFYLGGITDPEGDTQRYKELNRARSEVYQHVEFGSFLPGPRQPSLYPASTGIGADGTGLVASCVALQTPRPDVCLVALENPLQSPAYTYHRRYSPQSPKFSRAMALLLGDYLTTWISGTASIVQSESVHLSSIERQTEQTIDNIQALIAPSNLKAHGIEGAGASLRDLAKVRVYIKRPQDFAACKAICERRFPGVPAIYALADVCRPELLVEIEGVAFSRASAVAA